MNVRAGKRLTYLHTKHLKTQKGYSASRRIYQAEDCSGCSLCSLCHKGKYNRRIEVSHRLNTYRKKARDLLDSEQGHIQRSKRTVEVEAVFGQIKNNFRRFMLRGLEKMNAEFGLIAIAHNIMKWQSKLLDIPNNCAILLIQFWGVLRESQKSIKHDENNCLQIC